MGDRGAEFLLGGDHYYYLGGKIQEPFPISASMISWGGGRPFFLLLLLICGFRVFHY